MFKVTSAASGAAAQGACPAGSAVGGLVFLPAQMPVIPRTGELMQGSIEAQARQCLDNLDALLKDGSMGAHDIQKVTIYLIDMNDLDAVHAVCDERFAGSCPARTVVGAAALPLGARVQIEVIARKR